MNQRYVENEFSQIINYRIYPKCVKWGAHNNLLYYEASSWANENILQTIQMSSIKIKLKYDEPKNNDNNQYNFKMYTENTKWANKLYKTVCTSYIKAIYSSDLNDLPFFPLHIGFHIQ